jgi:osmoprotectant transport system ATP-binding protein
LDEPADAFVEGFIGRDRGFRSLSFQPASELKLDRVKVVRDVETATGAAPILVVDGDARPVGWADPERPGQVFALGSTFSPETDTLRSALDSALTSPYGLAVAVTGDTQRYAGVVSADDILDKVRDVRVSIAESISIREAEAAYAYESLADREDGYEPVGEPEEAYESDELHEALAAPEEAYESDEVHQPLAASEEAYESDELHDQPAESHQAYASDQLYDQLAEPEPANHIDSNESGLEDQQADVSAPPEGEVQRSEGTASSDSMDYPEAGEVGSAHDGEFPTEEHPISDEEDEGREANGEATHRRGSSVLQ